MKKIEHIGIAVKDLEISNDLFAKLFGVVAGMAGASAEEANAVAADELRAVLNQPRLMTTKAPMRLTSHQAREEKGSEEKRRGKRGGRGARILLVLC